MTDSINNFDDAGLDHVDTLLRRWAVTPVETDWTAFHDTVIARVSTEASDDELARVDRLLFRWSDQTAAVDEADFAAGVLNRIAQEHRKGIVYPRILRLAMPLAAAAAVALAVVTVFWSNPRGARKFEISIGPEHRLASAAIVKKAAVVSFERDADATWMDGRDVGISMLSVGASPLPLTSNDIPPL